MEYSDPPRIGQDDDLDETGPDSHPELRPSVPGWCPVRRSGRSDQTVCVAWFSHKSYLAPCETRPGQRPKLVFRTRDRPLPGLQRHPDT